MFNYYSFTIIMNAVRIDSPKHSIIMMESYFKVVITMNINNSLSTTVFLDLNVFTNRFWMSLVVLVASEYTLVVIEVIDFSYTYLKQKEFV
jgi:hypothetical protein